jgi:hypothetical protein
MLTEEQKDFLVKLLKAFEVMCPHYANMDDGEKKMMDDILILLSSGGFHYGN